MLDFDGRAAEDVDQTVTAVGRGVYVLRNLEVPSLPNAVAFERNGRRPALPPRAFGKIRSTPWAPSAWLASRPVKSPMSVCTKTTTRRDMFTKCSPDKAFLTRRLAVREFAESSVGTTISRSSVEALIFTR
jgi:hypothetical protein